MRTRRTILGVAVLAAMAATSAATTVNRAGKPPSTSAPAAGEETAQPAPANQSRNPFAPTQTPVREAHAGSSQSVGRSGVAPARANPDNANGVPALTPQVMAGIEKWVEATRPGENHRLLEYFVGHWNAEVRFSNIPGAMRQGPGGRGSGRVITTLTHGKRFIRSEFSGGVGGPGFTATGTLGFNNATGTFEGTWMDSTATGVRVSAGSFDPAARVFTLVSEFPDPVNASKTTFRETLTLDLDRYVQHVYEVGANGSQHLVQEVVYTRVK